MYDQRVDTVLPWLLFAVLAAIGIWMIAKNGQWWNSVVSSDFMPNPVLYYILWIIFLIIFPFAYMMTLEACQTQVHRIMVHIAMTLLAAFLLLWVIFLYHRRDVRTAIIFLGIAWFLNLLAVIAAFVLKSPSAGLWLLFLIWLTLVWFLSTSARAGGLDSMYNTLRERLKANKSETNISSSPVVK